MSNFAPAKMSNFAPICNLSTMKFLSVLALACSVAAQVNPIAVYGRYFIDSVEMTPVRPYFLSAVGY